MLLQGRSAQVTSVLSTSIGPYPLRVLLLTSRPYFFAALLSMTSLASCWHFPPAHCSSHTGLLLFLNLQGALTRGSTLALLFWLPGLSVLNPALLTPYLLQGSPKISPQWDPLWPSSLKLQSLPLHCRPLSLPWLPSLQSLVLPKVSVINLFIMFYVFSVFPAIPSVMYIKHLI